MLAITRYRVPATQTDDFVRTAQEVLSAVEKSPGHRSGRLGRAVDDPDLWAMVTDWDGAGYYRRALGAYDVRVALIPLSTLAIDEAGAYEIVETPEG
ncbi:antibiotic biosynthesis monooxygenase family protein [Actinomadura sp. DC4]|uniref:antibiotic biosynthesis monooxygenase family protein n=1 Tax=Actinomadura sp. DC4 TaxID=3055069 RepID=UPI0025AF02C3|nr:antibiotic biosynthesis monooxygenase family protein [Actinomadura sp. DC4]MDN3353440.1 antibiotic biosynthesis monooxygenase family protein [Actinomadura sp. DC4]